MQLLDPDTKTVEARIQSKELIPVTGRTRVPRNGSGRIVVPLCGKEVRIYHLSWSAMGCECGESHEKTEYFVVNPNPNPPDNDDPYHDRPCPECGEVVEQIGFGRPRIVCAGKCAKKRNIVKTIQRRIQKIRAAMEKRWKRHPINRKRYGGGGHSA